MLSWPASTKRPEKGRRRRRRPPRTYFEDVMRNTRGWWIVLALALVTAGAPAWGQVRGGKPLDAAIDDIAQHMVTAYPLKPPRNNIAVMQFVPTAGQPRRIGENLMTKVRIRMFDMDKDK